jgi:kynurenine formamidase
MPLIDLTRPADPTLPGFQSTVAKRLEVDGWNARTLTFYSHAGTHMDAPSHFLADGATLEDLPLEACVGEARCLDLGETPPETLHSVAQLEAAAGPLAPGSRLLLRTGWSRRHGTDDFRARMPGLSVEAAQWLVAQKVALIGVEPASVARVTHYPELKAVHEILLGAGIVIIEGLVHLDQLPPHHAFQLAALPLKIAGGDGCPARVVAWW